MLILAIHVVGISLLVLVVGSLAYRKGVEAGEKRLRRRLERQAEPSG